MDKHLNLFSFFNGNNLEYYEDNLSRAFALCLKYDTVFLDNILRIILNEQMYFDLFSTEYPDYHIEIDLQRKPNELENFSNIIAVACSGSDFDVAKMHEVQARETNSPETDVCILINDTCIIFEFKRTYEDCSAQLKCQAEKVKAICPDANEILYIDLNWRKIVKSLLNVQSLQKQINAENKFTSDFINFLERKHPEWFPKRLLKNISFPKNYDEPNNYYISARLNQIKIQIASILNAEIKEMSGKYSRFMIGIDWNWANEIHVDHVISENQNYITVKIFPGDTKAQGWHLYKPNKPAIGWPEKIDKFELDIDSYLKFSHFNSGLFWYHPTDEEYTRTHNYEFFSKVSGRYQKSTWPIFENIMSKISTNWKSNCSFDEYLTNSNRTYFDLSVGILLTVFIPYKEAQKLDYSENSDLAVEISQIILKIKQIIDNQ